MAKQYTDDQELLADRAATDLGRDLAHGSYDDGVRSWHSMTAAVEAGVSEDDIYARLGSLDRYR